MHRSFYAHGGLLGARGRLVLTALGLALATTALAVEPPMITDKVREYHQSHERQILDELFAWLALPNVADNRQDIDSNAEHLIAMLEKRGIAARKLEADGAPPAVFGQLDVPGATRTLVLYAHYDGQPADRSRWASEPWTPIVRDGRLEDGAKVMSVGELEGPIPGDWRIYARSASDDKSPIVAVLTALDALRAADIEPSVNLKFFFEGEEEAGSPHLGEILRAHKDLLAADLWIFCDGPNHASGRQQIIFGVRGAMELEMTVYGALRSLHSGHYGNWAPNPGMLLVDLIDSMRSGDGEVRIAGFYDGIRPLGEISQAALDAIPDADDQLRRDLGLARTEGDGERSVVRTLSPAMNLRGIAVAQVEEAARNAIPTEAKASFDFRLVPDQTPEQIRQLVERHIEGQGYHIVHDAPDLETRLAHPKIVRLLWGKGYGGQSTPLELPVSQAVIEIVEEALGEPVIKFPMIGGSLPLAIFYDHLATPPIVVPMVNRDNNQHAPNENLRIQNLWAGIEIYGNLIARLGQLW